MKGRDLKLLLTALLLAACSQAPPPAPNAALPDWSGAWLINNARPVSARAGAPQEGPPAEAPPPGAGPWTPGVPLRPQYQQVRLQERTERKVGIGNLASCKPVGMPGVMAHPMLIEFLSTPGRVTVLFQDGEVRRIYTDGRGHPPPEELEYGFQGHSIGHWEGSTLVVDTIGISDQSNLLLESDVNVTRNTHIVERIFLRDPQTLQIDTVVSDEELFSEPYAFSRTFVRSPLPMSEPGCAYNNRDSDTAVDLTPPPP